MIDDCTCMIRSPDAVRFCGANDRDYELFSARAAGSGITVSEMTDSLPHLCLQGPEQSPDPGATHRRRHVGRRVPVLHVPGGYRDRGHPGVRDPARVHRRARVRAVGRASPVPRAVGRADRRRRAVGDARDRDGRARPVSDRGRVHHRRGGVRPRRVAVRVRPGVVGGLRQADVAGARGARAGSRRDPAPARQRGPRVGWRRCDRRVPRRSTAPTSASITQAVVSPHLDGATLGLAKVDRDVAVPDTRVEARVGDASVPGRIVRHPVYDPERRRAKEACPARPRPQRDAAGTSAMVSATASAGSTSCARRRSWSSASSPSGTSTSEWAPAVAIAATDLITRSASPLAVRRSSRSSGMAVATAAGSPSDRNCPSSRSRPSGSRCAAVASRSRSAATTCLTCVRSGSSRVRMKATR